jgi:type VI secretion system Hcp family effector
MAGTIFLKVPGIEGEAKGAFAGQIIVEGFSYGMSQLVDRHKASGEVQFQDIQIAKIADKASPLLYKALCEGNEFGEDCILSAVRAAGDKSTLYLEVTMRKATLTSISSSGAEGAGLARETLMLQFGQILINYKDESDNKTEFTWNLDENKSQV